MEEEFEGDSTENIKRIDDHLADKKARNMIVLKQAETRNIIFLGRTRSGKSTALGVLKDPFEFTKQCSLFSQTKDPFLFSFTMEFNPEGKEGVNYNINIMDTPGLFERRSSKETDDARNNEMIKSIIFKCLEFEITKIHALFFVCSFESGINTEDVQSILEMNKLFGGGNKTFSLLVTRSETKIAKRRAELEEQIRKVPELQQFFKDPNAKVFFTGALNADDKESGAVDAVKRNLANVLNMRTILYNHVFDSTTPCHITELDIYKEHQQNIDQLSRAVKELTEKVRGYQGTVEEKKKLEVQLSAQTQKLKNAVSMVNKLQGQKDLVDLANIVEDAEKASNST